MAQVIINSFRIKLLFLHATKKADVRNYVATHLAEETE